MNEKEKKKPKKNKNQKIILGGCSIFFQWNIEKIKKKKTEIRIEQPFDALWSSYGWIILGNYLYYFLERRRRRMGKQSENSIR